MAWLKEKHRTETGVTLLTLLFSGLMATQTGCALFGKTPAPDDEYAGMDPYSRAKNQGNIVYGMPMEEVRRTWGEPREVSPAGDPSLRNEKWTYFEGLSSNWGISAAKEVYFEKGRVVGWRTQLPRGR